MFKTFLVDRGHDRVSREEEAEGEAEKRATIDRARNTFTAKRTRK